jgi:hypothetical protein
MDEISCIQALRPSATNSNYACNIVYHWQDMNLKVIKVMIAIKALRPAVLSFLRDTAVAALVVFNQTGLAGITTSIANTESSTTDGTASSSAFKLSVTSAQLANVLTTARDIELSLALAPQESHLGLEASIYTVIVAGGQYYKLADDGYLPWDGTIEDLTPFATGQTLQSLLCICLGAWLFIE